MSDQSTIINAAIESLSKITKLTKEQSAVQKKQNELLEAFNELIKNKQQVEDDYYKKHKTSTEQILNLTEELKQSYSKVQESVNKISNDLDNTIKGIKGLTGNLNNAAAAQERLNRAQKGQSGFFSNLSTKAKDALSKVREGTSNAFSDIKGRSGNLFGDILKKFAGGGGGKGGGILSKFMGIGPFLKRIPFVGQAIMLLGPVFSYMNNVFVKSIKYGTQFAKVLIGLPLKIVGALATKFGNTIRNEVIEVIGQAVENTKEFIDAGSRAGRGLKGLADEGAKDMGRLMNVRSDMVKLFGTGAGAIAAMIGEISDGIKNMGPLADTVGATIAKNEQSALFFVKATRSMGLAAADVQYLTAEAVKNGESLYDSLDRVMVSISKTAKASGLDQKRMSRNFFELRKDIINFGHLSDAQLAKTTSKITQMGLSMQEASAVFGKIDTFESAAQTSAMLSQTFGMNLDALQLLRAERPEEIIEQFRDAMLATGRSFDDLNRHEKSLMATHTGLTAESLKLMMNYRNLGMSYSEIQKKMSEDDPTQKQIKNLEMMSGSLKEIKKTMEGQNFFKSFANGVVRTITRSAGLAPHLMRISERMEDFFISGLTISKKAQTSLEGVFKPMTDVIVKLVGDGKQNKGLFDADKFKGVFESFTIKFGGLLSEAFKENSNLVDIQHTFRNELKKSFDFKNINQGNTIVGQLFKTSGKLIGQFLKGFAAIGPGMIDIAFDAVEGLINFLVNYKDRVGTGLLGSFGYSNSIKGMLSDLLGLNENDQIAIMGTFSHLIDRIIGAGGPFLRLYAWIQMKFAELVKDAMSIAMNAIGEGIKNSPIGSFIYGFNFGSNKYNFEEGQKKGKFLSLSNLNEKALQDLYDRENYEAFESDEIGKIYAMLEKEAKSQKYDTAKVNTLKSIMNQIQDAKGSTGMGLDEDDFVKSIARQVADYRGITLDVEKINGRLQNAKRNLLGEGMMATVKSTPNGIKVLQHAKDDMTLTAKPSEISYAGNAAAGFSRTISPNQMTQAQGVQNMQPLNVYMQVDGNTIAEASLDAGLALKLTQQINGRYYLPGNVVLDPAGGEVSGSAV